jgi:hypothetical protein
MQFVSRIMAKKNNVQTLLEFTVAFQVIKTTTMQYVFKEKIMKL